jgi:hypothetical protein
MTVETLAEAVGKASDRRTLLRRVGGASVGAVAAALGVASTAEASHCGSGTNHWRCCCICRTRDPNHCQGSNIVCCWIWDCCCTEVCNRVTMRCAECYTSTSYGCDAGCGGVACSTVWSLGTSC